MRYYQRLPFYLFRLFGFYFAMHSFWGIFFIISRSLPIISSFYFITKAPIIYVFTIGEKKKTNKIQLWIVVFSCLNDHCYIFFDLVLFIFLLHIKTNSIRWCLWWTIKMVLSMSFYFKPFLRCIYLTKLNRL